MAFNVSHEVPLTARTLVLNGSKSTWTEAILDGRSNRIAVPTAREPIDVLIVVVLNISSDMKQESLRARQQSSHGSTLGCSVRV